MATTPNTQERTTDNRQITRRFPSGDFEHLTHWLDITACTVGCTVIYAVMLFSAGSAALYLAVLLPGMAGVVGFFTVGLGLIAAAPEIANRVCIVVLDALEPYRVA